MLNFYYFNFWLQIQFEFDKQTMHLRQENKKTQFEKYYTDGHANLVEQKYDEALECFFKARKKFNPKEDQFYRLIDLFLDESRIYKSRKQFIKAQQKIRACQEEARRKYKNRNAEGLQYVESLACEVKLISQRAQIIIAEAQNFKERDSKFFEKINLCADNYAKAINIIATLLSGSNQQLESKFVKEDIDSWQQLYAEMVISSIDPIIVEAEKGEDNQNLYHLVYQIAEKMGRFYKLSHKNKLVVKQNSRSMYYRGTMLLKTSVRYSEIESFFLKDYQYCRNHNFRDDLEKTRNQLISYYIKIERLDEARKYLRTDEEKKLFSQVVVGNMRQLKKLEEQIKSDKFLALSPSAQLEKLEKVNEIVSNSDNNWWPRFISVARCILPHLKKREVNYYVCWKTAKCYFENFDELNALHFCHQSLKYCESSSERYQILFLMMQIYSATNRWEKLIEVQKELLLIVEQADRQSLLSHIKDRELQKKRCQILTQKLLYSQKQKIMFEILESAEQQRRGEKITQQISQIEIVGGQNSNPRPTFMRPKQEYNNNSVRKQRKQILREIYESLCEKAKIQVRLPILEQIRNMRTEDMFITIKLHEFFELTNAQLQIYLEIIRNEEWDLRNFILKQNFIKKFVQKIPFNEIRVLKICSISRQVATDELHKLIGRLSFVQQLHMENLDRKFGPLINKMLLQNLMGPLENLRILKLKNCRIVDESLLNLYLIHPQLTQLDLGGNEITGKNLAGLNKMNSLQKLNLSYNPIQELHPLENPNLTKLKLKSLKHYPVSTGMKLPQIKFLQILDISENRSEVMESIIRCSCQFLLQEQFLELPNFREMRAKKSNISEQFLVIFNQFINFCLGFQNLDIRFCHYDPVRLGNLQKYLVHCGKNFSIDARAGLSQPVHQKP